MKDEFLKYFKNEFVVYGLEIRVQFNELQLQVEQFVLSIIEKYGLNKYDVGKFGEEVCVEVYMLINKVISDVFVNVNIEVFV